MGARLRSTSYTSIVKSQTQLKEDGLSCSIYKGDVRYLISSACFREIILFCYNLVVVSIIADSTVNNLIIRTIHLLSVLVLLMNQLIDLSVNSFHLLFSRSTGNWCDGRKHIAAVNLGLRFLGIPEMPYRLSRCFTCPLGSGSSTRLRFMATMEVFILLIVTILKIMRVIKSHLNSPFNITVRIVAQVLPESTLLH